MMTSSERLLLCADRIVREWQSNVLLYIHHDNLKQERIRHFLSIQAALLAFVGVAIKLASEPLAGRMFQVTFLSFGIGISVMAGALTAAWTAMDERARKFILFERKRLRELENEWAVLFDDQSGGLNTYRGLASVLETPRLGAEFDGIGHKERTRVLGRYIADYAGLENPGRAASGLERIALRIILGFWVVSVVGHVSLLAWFVTHGFRFAR